jgi:Ca2+:H+ antiporter
METAANNQVEIDNKSSGFSYLNYLLIFIPVCLVLYIAKAASVYVFITAAISIIPLAGLMGKSTEQLAIHSGPAVGGLLNATFGNAAELIIALFALKEGLVSMVQASLTGSIVGNILLVLGMSMIAGGIKYKTQKINIKSAGANIMMLTVVVVALAMPAFYYYGYRFSITGSGLSDATLIKNITNLSIGVSIILIMVYVLSLYFSHRTHKHLLSSEPIDTQKASWSRRRSAMVLLLATVAIAIQSEMLVSTVASTANALNLNYLFVGVVIVAIIGNVAEHSTAISAALKNKMELSYQISIGSATQIALFVAPVLVLTGFVMGVQMYLAFEPFEVIAIWASVFIATAALADGETNWFEGAMFVAVYTIIGMVFFIHP